MHPVVGRDDISGGALNRLDEDRRNRAGGTVLDLLAREVRASDAATWIAQLERTSITIRIRHEITASRKWPIALLPFVADMPDDAAGLAMKTAPETDRLEFFRLRAREAQRGLDRLSAAAVKMCALEAAGRDFAQQFECLGTFGIRQRPNHQARGLMRDRLRQRGMSMPEAGHRDTREEIDVYVSIGVSEGGALAMIDCNTG